MEPPLIQITRSVMLLLKPRVQLALAAVAGESFDIVPVFVVLTAFGGENTLVTVADGEQDEVDDCWPLPLSL